MPVVLSFRYRLLPTSAQHRALALVLESQRHLYNAALEERIDAWRKGKVRRTFIDQCKALTECRAALPEMAEIPANIQRGTLKRLDEAFAGFFRRIKRSSGKAGFPRFKGAGWWTSFDFAEFSGVTFDGKRLHSKAWPGGLRVRMHRALPNTKILAARFKRDSKGWYVSLAVRVESAEPRKGNRHVGIDMGIARLATLSTGEKIPNPRPAKRAERELRRRQRALARCKKGSSRRRKMRVAVGRLHAKVSATRETYLHQQAAKLVANYDLIAIEDLSIKNMAKSAKGTTEEPGANVAAKSGLNRSIHDAGWGRFFQFVDYKAARAGVAVKKVDPKHTSQTCPRCAHRAPENRLTRDRFRCKECGHEEDADLVGATNVLARAVVGPGVVNVAHQSVRSLGNITPRQEAGNSK